MSGPAKVGPTRLALGALGVLVGGYGAWLLLSREGSAAGLIAAAIWLVVGVVLHDGVLAPLTILLAWVAGRALPVAARLPAVVGLVVLGSVTIFAIPVLGRFGARSDNPTLLDRHYDAAWLVLAAVVVVAVVAATLVRRRGAGSAGREEAD